jgi:transposase
VFDARRGDTDGDVCDGACVRTKAQREFQKGKAINYMLRHWRGLTVFLRQPGAPIDNNLCEQVLKRAVLHRKNALFYRTLNGAEVGDLFMSLIHTCELGGANSFHYLTELQRHAAEAAANPSQWMPWNYRETLEPTAGR